MSKEPFKIGARIKSFSHAFRGIGIALSSEHNLWVHFLAMIAAIFLGLWFEITRMEWIAVFFAIGLVLSAELLNSAIESLGDAISEEHNDHIGRAKDMAAGGVLITAITALVIGVVVFLPYFL